jgi:hypothetical protein
MARRPVFADASAKDSLLACRVSAAGGVKGARGLLEIVPGEEMRTFAEVANGSHADVVLSGRFESRGASAGCAYSR